MIEDNKFKKRLDQDFFVRQNFGTVQCTVHFAAWKTSVFTLILIPVRVPILARKPRRTVNKEYRNSSRDAVLLILLAEWTAVAIPAHVLQCAGPKPPGAESQSLSAPQSGPPRLGAAMARH
jgi:hypothetical protein